MREILFRGKRVDDGEWVCGNSIIMLNNPEADKPYDIAIFDEHWQLWQTVDPETVGQYTGLTDRNGKKIFEGDVLRLRDSWSAWAAIVEFGNPNGLYSWGWQLKPIRRVSVNTDILCWVKMEETGAYCEVIGNIYDNN